MKKILTILLMLFVSLSFFGCSVEPKGKYIENPNKTENQDIVEEIPEVVEEPTVYGNWLFIKGYAVEAKTKDFFIEYFGFDKDALTDEQKTKVEEEANYLLGSEGVKIIPAEDIVLKLNEDGTYYSNYYGWEYKGTFEILDDEIKFTPEENDDFYGMDLISTFGFRVSAEELVFSYEFMEYKLSKLASVE